ncbi:hypothetical protein CLV31_10917 [Algoriphagus aquaeductus]|uniref:Uncharacterized protein n=1 Tax=Algoriphagus aquaeductus TaxID=475299 RepID=A0A326RP94_9BACT|nr:hypothetical protein CLV31_10917 [Algoriphagus aquaeductus]
MLDPKIGLLLTSLMVLLVILIILRFVGAWLFRIDDVIDLQKKIFEELKRINSK